MQGREEDSTAGHTRGAMEALAEQRAAATRLREGDRRLPQQNEAALAQQSIVATTLRGGEGEALCAHP